MSTRIQILKDGVITVVKTASDRQLALNSLVTTMTANRVLRSNGTNIVLSQIDLSTDIITGVLPTANGGSGNSASYVDLTTNQTIGGTKNFSDGLVLPTSVHTSVGAIWRNGANLEFRNNANTTQIILNSAGNLANLSDKQVSLNNLVGTQTANRVLRSDGTNVTLSQVNLANDVTGIVTISNGGTGSSSQNFVDLTTNQSVGGIKTFSGGLLLPSTPGTTVSAIWRNIDNLEYKDSNNVTKVILNSAGNLSNLANKQTSLNNLVGTQTASRVLRSDGTNVTLSQVALDTDVINILPIGSGGTGSNTQNFVDLTTAQTIGGAKTFSGSPIIITASTTGTGGTGSVLKVVQTGAWSANSPYVLEVIGYSYLDGFRITGQGGARGIYQIGSGFQLDFATNAGDITFTSGATGTVERMRVYTSDGRVRIFSTVATTSTTTGALTVAGGVGINGGICATLPTSSAGLTAGMFWRNGNVVNIV